MENKSLYAKLQQIKLELSQTKLKKSGYNKFSGFDYFELADFLPTLIALCNKYGVYTYTTFDTDYAILTAVNADDPEQKISVSSPMKELNVISKEGNTKMNELQALGAVETYQRRYLYMSMFDIVENDGLDSLSNGDQEAKPEKSQDKKIFQLEWEGQVYNVSYVKKFSKNKNKWFYLIEDESQSQFFPRYMNCEDQ